MERREVVLKHVRKDMLGIEVAPYFAPLAPKRDGWNCMVVDVFPTEELQLRASRDPDPVVSKNVDRIESVDIVSSATELDVEIGRLGMLGRFDYICSSHNFEHLPNPLRFLRGAGEILRTGGMLSMAIPNKRLTFDCVRPLSDTSDFLRAFYSGKSRPDPFDIFAQDASRVTVRNPGRHQTFDYTNDLTEAFERLMNALDHPSESYTDVHYTVYTPYSFVHIMTELAALNLIPLRLVEMQVSGIEFIVHMKNVGYSAMTDERKKILAIRQKLAERLSVAPSAAR
jgi:SAM-dependent methyltransferase